MLTFFTMFDEGDVKYHVFINGSPSHTGNENINLYSSKRSRWLLSSVLQILTIKSIELHR